MKPQGIEIVSHGDIRPRRGESGADKRRPGIAFSLTVACFALCLCAGCASGATESVQAAETESVQAAGTEAERAIVPRDASQDLLLIVDFQKVYLPGYDWACPGMPEAVKNTVKILESPDAPDYLMTKYIAPANPTGRWEQYNEAYRDINENPVLNELAEELLPYAAESVVVEKPTYSSMKAERTLSALEGKKAVVLAGVTAECCVLATMMDAIDMGYEVVYLYDCIAGQSAELDAEIRGLAEIFAPVHTTIMSSDEYLVALRGA